MSGLLVGRSVCELRGGTDRAEELEPEQGEADAKSRARAAGGANGQSDERRRDRRKRARRDSDSAGGASGTIAPAITAPVSHKVTTARRSPPDAPA